MMAVLEEYYYEVIRIPKKRGGERSLQVPVILLRSIQKWILDNILNNLYVSEFAMGFCKAKSIVTNANVHLNKKCIVNMDLKDFFPSITQEQVFRIFYYYGYTIGVSNMLARICTYDGFLPQGAPTSPYISNLVCLRLDKRLSKMAERYKATYSRYADDITFSADGDISNIVKVAEEIINSEGFKVNSRKTRVLFQHQRQEVTGLLVNGEKVRVEKSYLKKLKQEIYYCKKYGVDNHLNHIGCTKRFYKDHLYGKVYFVNMVDSEIGKKLLDDMNNINWD